MPAAGVKREIGVECHQYTNDDDDDDDDEFWPILGKFFFFFLCVCVCVWGGGGGGGGGGGNDKPVHIWDPRGLHVAFEKIGPEVSKVYPRHRAFYLGLQKAHILHAK